MVMRKSLKIASYIGVALVLALATMIASFLMRGGAFRQIQSVSPGICRLVPTNHGSAEDIQINRQTGIAYLSALDRRGLVAGNEVTGNILEIDLYSTNPKPTSALESVPEGFRPHGISLFYMQDGSERLFVINDWFGIEERIEIFDKPLDNKLFEHVETLSDPLITHPNDLVAVGPEKFYIANDSGATNSLERVLEMGFGIGLSPLIFFNGENFLLVDSQLKSSGGINADLTAKRLYVGETMGKSIRVYELDDNQGLSRLVRTIALDGGVDNIDIEVDGSLWIANITNTLALVRHFTDEDSPAPIQVQKVVVHEESDSEIQTVLENNGNDFSAASVAARLGEMIIIGSITEPAVMLCELGT